MKLLFEQQDHGYSWSNPHKYYLCESMEEYNALVEKWKDHKNCRKGTIFGREVEIPECVQVRLDDMIVANPQTDLLDGYVHHGGREFVAHGLTVKNVSRTPNMDYSSYTHYVKPGTIVKDDTVESTGWWA